MVNIILAKRVNHIVAKGGNPVWPKGSKSRGFSTTDEEHYGHMTIQAIYEEVGYTNAVSFNRTFKKINGMTPAMYKKLAADNMKG